MTSSTVLQMINCFPFNFVVLIGIIKITIEIIMTALSQSLTCQLSNFYSYTLEIYIQWPRQV